MHNAGHLYLVTRQLAPSQNWCSV